MGGEWTKDKAWSDKFLPEVKYALVKYLVNEANFRQDATEATDLVLDLKSIRVAVRIRKFADYEKYRHQFTLRSSRISGAKTELIKIISGYGDFIFYGFANYDETSLHSWILGNLYVLREWLYRKPSLQEIPNKDGATYFIPINLSELPTDFIVASSYDRSRNQR